MRINTLLSISFLLMLLPLEAEAQQNVGDAASNLVSPVVNDNNTVTFLLDAPKAKMVRVIGDWSENPDGREMAKNKSGLWSLTTDSLASEMYTYRYIVDGMTIIDPANPFTKRDVGAVFSVFFIGGGVADNYQVQNVPHGNIIETWYHSNRLGMNRRMQVYTPPFYDTANRNYPVLYLLHGSGGDENAWVELGNVARIMDNLIAKGKAEPMIVVMPNGNPGMEAAPGETSKNLAYRPTMSNNLPGFRNGAYEESFPEIVNFIDAKYRTIPKTSHRAIAGLSMGGFHSKVISANYPGLFDYVGLFSAGFPLTEDSIPAYADMEQKVKVQIDKGLKLYWVGCGIDDKFKIHDKSRDFVVQMKDYGANAIFYSSPKGHVWSNWRQYLLMFVPKLFQ